jgi:1-acyl-sn-glycerol-3-phosphate acyltransferase
MIKALLSFSCYFVNTVFWFTPIIILSVFKLIPIKSLQKFITIGLDACASGWVTVNTGIQKVFCNYKLHVSGDSELSEKDWYLVLANHQSWTDIVVLQRYFNGKIPFLKFFLKKELIYVPILGLAWWALDFPFMRRYSKSFLAKNPHLKGKDLETTKKACERFKFKPVSVMNFIEGTRFTPVKHEKQNSPFNSLLRPKSGGIGYVLTVMGEQLHKVVDVTIYYPKQIPTFYHFLSGQIKDVYVHVNLHEISQELLGDYSKDQAYKKQLHQWVNSIWLEKEQTLMRLKHQSETAN